MAEENRVEPQQITKEPQQTTKEPQGKAAQLPSGAQPVQGVTTKNPKKVEAGRGWLRTIVRKEKRRKENKQNWRPAEIGDQ